MAWDGYKKSVYIYDDDNEAYYNEILEKSNTLLEEQQALKEEQALQKKIEEANKLNVMNGYGIVKENTNYNFIQQTLTSVYKDHIYKQDKQTGVLKRINSIDYSEGFYVNDDYLINLGRYCIERIDLATNKKIKLVDEVDVRMLARSGFLIGDWFYYSDVGIYINGKKNPPSFNRVNILTGKIDYIQDDRFTDMIYFDGYFIGKNKKESGNSYNYFNLNTLQFEDKLEVRQYIAPGLYTKDGIIGSGFSLNPLLLDLDEKVVKELPVDVEIEGTVAIDYQYNYCFMGDYLYGITDGWDDNYYFVKINYVTMDYQVKPFVIDEYRPLYLTAIDNRFYFSASDVIPGTSVMGDYSIYSMDLNGEDIQLVIK